MTNETGLASLSVRIRGHLAYGKASGRFLAAACDAPLETTKAELFAMHRSGTVVIVGGSTDQPGWFDRVQWQLAD